MQIGKMGDMMKMARKAQEAMEQAEAKMAEMRVEASAGGGMVKVVANGHQEIVSIAIDKEVVDPEDVEMLEDLVLAAVKEAQTKAKEEAQKERDDLMGDMGLPDIPGLF